MSFRQLIVLVGCAVALLAVPSAIATANGLSWDPSNPLPSDISVAAAENTPSQTVTWTDPVALDASSNPFPATCSPTSGSSFLLGTMPVTCSADDGVGDTISDSFNVTVGPDSTPPVLQNVPSNQTIEVVGPVPGTFSYSISATDNVTPSCTSPYGLTGGSFPYATTTVTCIADDSTGNVDTGSFTVTVQDTIKPTIGPHADVPVTVSTTPAAVTYTNPTTSEPAVVTCAPASGSSFPSGTTTVTCNATDAAGNPAVSTTTFRVVVTDNTGSLDFRIAKRRHWGGYHFPRHWYLHNAHSLALLSEQAGLEVHEMGTLMSPVNWVYSVRNALDDWRAPRALVNQFSLEAPLALAAGTAFDALHQLAGRGALLRAILRRSR